MSTKRLKHTVISKGIVVGSISYPQSTGSGPAAAAAAPEGYRMHTWALYVRGVDHEDLSHIVRAVEIDLDPTFFQPHRVIAAPGPFVLVESGWGEFVATVTLRFVDDLEKPLSLFHSIRLFDAAHPPPVRPGATAPPVPTTGSGTGAAATGLGPDGKPLPYVLSEHYDEIVFVNPTEAMHERVMRTRPRPAVDVAPLPPRTMQMMAPVFQVRPDAFSDAQDLRDISVADANVSARLVQLNNEYANLEMAEQAYKLYIQRTARYNMAQKQQQQQQQQQQKSQ